VIVTEDDADLREVLMELLRERGLNPIAATTLSEVERALDVRSDAVLLLDLRLGEESGLEWLHALCVKGEAPRTVIVSGSKHAKLVAARLGVGFVLKPFAVDVLCSEASRAQRPSRRAIVEIIETESTRR